MQSLWAVFFWFSGATARLLPAQVRLETQRDTASTDGHTVISMPAAFCGYPIPDHELISVGLLAHTASHFLQPLPRIHEMARQEAIPHWLVNLILDVQGESLVETIFPSLHTALTATRQAMADSQSQAYRRNLSQAQTFVEAAGDLLLYCRFADPNQPFREQAAADWGNAPYGTLGVHLTDMIAEAALLAPVQVADFLQRLIVTFPELRQVRPPLMPMDAPRSQSGGPIAGMLLDEIQQHVGQWRGSGGTAILTKVYRLDPPHPEAVQPARQIRPRFDTSRIVRLNERINCIFGCQHCPVNSKLTESYKNLIYSVR